MNALRALIKATGKPLVVDVDINDKIFCYQNDVYTKDGVALMGTVGRDTYLMHAISNYLDNLVGKTLVINPTGENRKEILVMGPVEHIRNEEE